MKVAIYGPEWPGDMKLVDGRFVPAHEEAPLAVTATTLPEALAWYLARYSASMSRYQPEEPGDDAPEDNPWNHVRYIYSDGWDFVTFIRLYRGSTILEHLPFDQPFALQEGDVIIIRGPYIC